MTTVYVAVSVAWQPGVCVTPIECQNFPSVLKAPDAIAPLGWIKMLKKDKFPHIGIAPSVLAVAALTEKEALDVLIRVANQQWQKAEEQVSIYASMVRDLENGVRRLPRKRES